MKFEVNKNIINIKIENEKLTSANINFFQANFEFDKSWENLTKEVIILKENEEKGITRAIIDNKIYIDQSLEGAYYIGVIGYTIENDKKVYQISTNLLAIFFEKGAGEIQTDKEVIPTLNEWEIYIKQIENLVKTVPDYIKNITENDIKNWNNKVDKIIGKGLSTNDFTDEYKKKVDNCNTEQFANDINDLKTTKADKMELTLLEDKIGNKVNLNINSNYVMTLNLLNAKNEVLSSATIDFPIESMIINASYMNGIITLTLQNGTTLDVNISNLVNGLVNETTFNNTIDTINTKIDNLINDTTSSITTTYSSNKINDLIKDFINKDVNNLTNYYNKKEINTQQNEQDDLINNNSIKLTSESENITVNDSSDLRASIQIKGNSKQKTTKGINIISLSKIPQKQDGITIQKIDNNTVIFNGTPTKDYIRFMEFNIDTILEDKTTYTLWQEKYSGNSANKKGVLNIIQIIEKTSGKITYISGGKEKTSFVTDKGKNTYRYIIGTDTIANTGTLVNYKNSYMIYKGIENYNYEPYTGGYASPNPDYPQEIQKVTGNVEINQTGKENTENIFDNELEHGDININTGLLESASIYTRSKNFIKVKPNTKYLLTRTITNGIFWIIGYDINKNGIIDGNFENHKSSLNKINPQLTKTTFITTNTTHFIKFKNTANSMNDIVSITEAPQNKTYSLHLGNIELNKIGEKQDYIYKNLENNKWYVHKKIDKYKMNENDNIRISLTLKNTVRIYFDINKSISEVKGYCNILSYNSNWTRDEEGYYYNGLNSKGVIFRINKSTIGTTEEAVKEYIKNHPIIFYFVLSVPEETEITDPILIAELEALYNTKTFSPTTNLTNNSIAIMKLDYIADTKNYIDNKIASIIKTNLTN